MCAWACTFRLQHALDEAAEQRVLDALAHVALTKAGRAAGEQGPGLVNRAQGW